MKVTRALHCIHCLPYNNSTYLKSAEHQTILKPKTPNCNPVYKTHFYSLICSFIHSFVHWILEPI